MKALRALCWMAWLASLSGCTHMFFQPRPELIDAPSRYGIAYSDEHLTAADGTPLDAWFIPARGAAKGTILFLHGNAENISTHSRSVLWLAVQGYNVLALDYRGYGASGGEPSLQGVQLDIDAAMRHLLQRKDVDASRIMVLGQSLGGALALYYCAHSTYKQNIRGVISDSAFSDYRRVARDSLSRFVLTWPFQWLPRLLINNDYAPQDAIAAISPIPLLIIHGEQDKVVETYHAQRLFEKAGQPKQLLLVPEAGHIQAFVYPQAREQVLAFLERVLK